jgi:hypothetical protein
MSTSSILVTGNALRLRSMKLSLGTVEPSEKIPVR